MPVVTLTARNVPTLPAAGARTDYWDALLPGFGLRVTDTGTRSWTIRYRHHGRLWRLTLGHYPTVSLAAAREQGRNELRRAGLGQHPAGKKMAERARDTETVEALLAEYAKVASTKRSWREEKRTLERAALPAWRSERSG